MQQAIANLLPPSLDLEMWSTENSLCEKKTQKASPELRHYRSLYH